VIRVFRRVNYLVRTLAGLSWKHLVNQLLARRYVHSYAIDSVLPFDVSSSIDVPVTTSRPPVLLSVDADVQGEDSILDFPPVSAGPGLVSGEAPSPVSKVPPSPVMSAAQCAHVSSRRVVRPEYLGDYVI